MALHARMEPMTQYAYHRPAPGSQTWNLIRRNREQWDTVQIGLTMQEAHRLYEERIAEQQPAQGELDL